MSLNRLSRNRLSLGRQNNLTLKEQRLSLSTDYMVMIMTQASLMEMVYIHGVVLLSNTEPKMLAYKYQLYIYDGDLLLKNNPQHLLHITNLSSPRNSRQTIRRIAQILRR